MQAEVFRDGMQLPSAMFPVEGVDDLYSLQAVHGEGWIARSYLVVRASGNILISPLIYTEGLSDYIEAKGGLRHVFITHRDELETAVLSEVGRDGPGDPPAHIPAFEYRKRFGCTIAAHQSDRISSEECVVDLLWNNDVSEPDGLQFLHTPGHTAGSASLLVSENRPTTVFCGDALSLNDSGEIDTSFEDMELERAQTILRSWSKLAKYQFEVLVPLHTYSESPRGLIPTGGRVALVQAIAEAEISLERLG